MVETERLIIRLAEASEVGEIVRFYRDNQAFLQPYSPAFGPELFDQGSWHQQVVERQLELTRRESFRAFIFTTDAPSRIAGNINLTQVVHGAFESCVLGYSLAEDFQGHGYMTEAVRAVLRLAFDDWRLHRVQAAYMPRNTRSGAVLERCGFAIEGLAPAYLRINGRWEDHVVTAAINPAWSPGQA